MAQPVTQPMAQPMTQPVVQPMTQPAVQPMTQPAVQQVAFPPASPPAATNTWSPTPLTDAARAHVAAQTAFRASQADASTGLAAALSGTVPQQLRPSPLFEDLGARQDGRH